MKIAIKKKPDTNSRFLDSFFDHDAIILLWAGLGTIGLINFGFLAWTGEKFAVVGLTVFGFAWLFLAALNSRSWRGTLRDWRRTTDSWGETTEYVNDLHQILNETLGELSTWDRDKANEIGERCQTISRLRLKNLEEKWTK